MLGHSVGVKAKHWRGKGAAGAESGTSGARLSRLFDHTKHSQIPISLYQCFFFPSNVGMAALDRSVLDAQVRVKSHGWCSQGDRLRIIGGFCCLTPKLGSKAKSALRVQQTKVTDRCSSSLLMFEVSSRSGAGMHVWRCARAMTSCFIQVRASVNQKLEESGEKEKLVRVPPPFLGFLPSCAT